ncbi:MAG: hypothetical protein HQL06_15735, partial [Nitrospirae bacterium]|nr:hypothetical protein [Nitrospirota bacterium]
MMKKILIGLLLVGTACLGTQQYAMADDGENRALDIFERIVSIVTKAIPSANGGLETSGGNWGRGDGSGSGNGGYGGRGDGSGSSNGGYGSRGDGSGSGNGGYGSRGDGSGSSNGG